MSVGHRLEDWELSDTSLSEVYHALGANDTAALFDQPYKLDTSHDWPAAGGMSLDRKTVYIDRTIYQELMDEEFKAAGISGQQILNCWILHERSENAIIVGDNPVDGYTPAHNRALALEHEMYRVMGCDPAEVEKVIWPGLVRCYKRHILNPPRDAWCGVYFDDPGADEEEIIAQLLVYNVIDARKRSKYESNYGVFGSRCDQCRNRDEKLLKQGPLFGCSIVSGAVRDSRGCHFWMPEDEAAGIDQAQDKLSQSTVDYTDKGHKPELCGGCMHFEKPDRCEIVKGQISAMGWCRLWHR